MVGGIKLPTTPILPDREGSELDITLSPEANRLLVEEIERLRHTSFVIGYDSLPCSATTELLMYAQRNRNTNGQSCDTRC